MPKWLASGVILSLHLQVISTYLKFPTHPLKICPCSQQLSELCVSELRVSELSRGYRLSNTLAESHWIKVIDDIADRNKGGLQRAMSVINRASKKKLGYDVTLAGPKREEPDEPARNPYSRAQAWLFAGWCGRLGAQYADTLPVGSGKADTLPLE
jgi:hypothetical protein